MTAAIAPAASTLFLRADSIGYLVPAHDFAGAVHSVFASACNIAVGGTLVTLVARRDAEAPATIVLRDARMPDLRRVFHRGRVLVRRGARLVGEGVTVSLDAATVWRPDAPASRLSAAQMRHNVDFVVRAMQVGADAAASLTRTVHERLAQLETVVSALDLASAQTCVAALVGLGDGLTPAGDDALVGLLAGLELLADGAPRQSFLGGLRQAVGLLLSATTDISAHQLRLATGGHYSAALERLRASMIGEPSHAELARALQRVLAFGATSGADTVHGLLAAFRAWLAPMAGET